MQDSLKKLGVEPLPMTPAEMDAFVAREIADNLALIKAAGIKPLSFRRSERRRDRRVSRVRPFDLGRHRGEL